MYKLLPAHNITHNIFFIGPLSWTLPTTQELWANGRAPLGVHPLHECEVTPYHDELSATQTHCKCSAGQRWWEQRGAHFILHFSASDALAVWPTVCALTCCFVYSSLCILTQWIPAVYSQCLLLISLQILICYPSTRKNGVCVCAHLSVHQPAPHLLSPQIKKNSFRMCWRR